MHARMLAIALLATGCFGDWVKAKKRPQRDDLPAPVAAPKVVDEGPVQPCLVYQATIARVCESLLVGTLERASCYAEILRMSGKAAIEPDKDRPTDALNRRERSCASDLTALQARLAEGPGRPTKGGLPPTCRAWADELRTRCLVPLLHPEPALPARCGGWFMSFQSTVQGRAERREDACARAQAAAQQADAPN